MKQRRLIVGGGLKEMGKLLEIMSKRSIMDMELGDDHAAGCQQVEEVPLNEVRGRITSFIGCKEHLGNCAACPGCWEYFGDLQYAEDIFELEEELDFLDFDTQFEQTALQQRRRAADELAERYLRKFGIVGIYGGTDGEIKVFVRGNPTLTEKALPGEFMGWPVKIIQSKSPGESSPTAPCGPAEMFND